MAESRQQVTTVDSCESLPPPLFMLLRRGPPSPHMRIRPLHIFLLCTYAECAWLLICAWSVAPQQTLRACLLQRLATSSTWSRCWWEHTCRQTPASQCSKQTHTCTFSALPMRFAIFVMFQLKYRSHYTSGVMGNRI